MCVECIGNGKEEYQYENCNNNKIRAFEHLKIELATQLKSSYKQLYVEIKTKIFILKKKMLLQCNDFLAFHFNFSSFFSITKIFFVIFILSA